MALTRINSNQLVNEQWKQPVLCATVSDVGNLYLGNTQPNSIDGVSLGVGSRILVKNQADATQNGLWDVLTLGTGSNGWWVRTVDANQAGEIATGLTVVVAQGSVNASQEYRLTTPNPITINSTALTFINPFQASIPGGANTYVQFNDAGTLSGTSAVTFNKYSNVLTVTGNLSVGNLFVSNIFYPNGAPYSIGGGSGSSYYIYSGASNVTVTPSYVNVAINSSNIASFSANGISTTGNLTVGNISTGNLSATTLYALTSVTTGAVNSPFIGNAGTALVGTLSTAAQTNITSVGSLTSLNVLNNATIGGNLTVTGTITTLGNVNNITITGNSGQFFGNTNGFGALYAGIGVGYTFEPQTILQLSANYNGYAQLNLQNTNGGPAASGDLVVTMDTGNTNQGYIDLGINSSGFTGGAGNELNYPGDGYLYVQGNVGGPGGNLLLSTGTANDIVFSLNGEGSANEVGRFSYATKSLKITGNVNASGNLIVGTGTYGTQILPFVGSTYGAIYSTASTPSSSNYVLGYNGTNTLLNAATSGTVQVGVAGSVYLTVQPGTASSTQATGQSVVIGSNGLGVTGASYFLGNLGINGNITIGPGSALSYVSLLNNLNVAGGTTAWAQLNNGLVQSGVTAQAGGFESQVSAVSASFTLGQMYHFYANPQAAGTGATITNQTGFYAENTLGTLGAATITGAYGFYGNVAGGAGRYNLYMAGTAQNYLAGNLTIANTTPSTNTTTGALQVTGGVGIGGNLYVGGGLAFSSTGQFITGDFTNSVVTNRVAFQTNTNNNSTLVTAIPNGSGSISGFEAYGNSNPTNTAVARFIVNATETRILSTIVGTGAYLPMTFYLGGSERLRVDTGGNLLIGNTSPTTYNNVSIYHTTTSTSTTSGALQVAGGVGIGGNLYVGTVGAVSGAFHSVVGNITQTSSGGAVYINTTGNVLAATGTFNALTLNGTLTGTGYINTSANISASQINANFINPANLLVRGASDGTGSMNVSGTINVLSNVAIGGNINLTTAGVVGGGGNILINGVAGNIGQVLTQGGTGVYWAAAGTSTTDNTSTAATYYPTFVTAVSGSTFQTSSTKLTFNPSTGTFSATIFNTLSDENYKTNIVPITDAVSTVRQLEGVGYRWLDNRQKSYGVIAQELEKILPDLVDSTNPNRKTVNYNGIIAFLINAVKELDQRVKNLESR